LATKKCVKGFSRAHECLTGFASVLVRERSPALEVRAVTPVGTIFVVDANTPHADADSAVP
jgi:hypothetical protein